MQGGGIALVRRAFCGCFLPFSVRKFSGHETPRNITCWGVAGCQSDNHRPPPEHLRTYQ